MQDISYGHFVVRVAPISRGKEEDRNKQIELEEWKAASSTELKGVADSQILDRRVFWLDSVTGDPLIPHPVIWYTGRANLSLLLRNKTAFLFRLLLFLARSDGCTL